jgi:ATP-dependent Clp protease ATP-binding subunit ClpA
MATRRKRVSEFDTAAAIKELEANKEKQLLERDQRRLQKQKRDLEKARLQKENDEKERLAHQEKEIKLLENDGYFRFSLLESIASLTGEVGRLSKAMEDAVTESNESKEAGTLMKKIVACIGYSDSSGLPHIRAKYIPKDYY